MKLPVLLFLSFIAVQLIMLVQFLYEKRKQKTNETSEESVVPNIPLPMDNSSNSSNTVQKNNIGTSFDGVQSDSTYGSAYQNTVLLGDYVENYENNVQNNMQQSDMNSSDYLPQECNNKWFGFGNEDENCKPVLNTAKLIDLEKYTSSLDTIGTTNRNSTYDIRGEVPVEKSIVSPFLNSSIDYNLYSKNALCN